MVSAKITATLTGLTLVTSLSSCGVRESYVRAKQVRTFADLQTISARIDDAILKNRGNIEPAQALEIVRSVNQGRDAWGNEIRFHSGVRNGKFSYVLISPGDDGKLDLASLDEYLSMPPSDVQGLGEKDIVFRDGQPVANAGK